jgi:hypothetical protein
VNKSEEREKAWRKKEGRRRRLVDLSIYAGIASVQQHRALCPRYTTLHATNCLQLIMRTMPCSARLPSSFIYAPIPPGKSGRPLLPVPPAAGCSCFLNARLPSIWTQLFQSLRGTRYRLYSGCLLAALCLAVLCAVKLSDIHHGFQRDWTL